ncbi:MAG: TrkH family potassium uptake protein [Saprospiraceae bacterium]|nr:TrkH family potassium uptake protein [Saprospiraceae bacterium]
MLSFRDTIHVVGALLMILGLSVFLCVPVSIHYSDGQLMPILYSGFAIIGIGILGWLARPRGGARINKRTGYLIVTLGWLAISAFAMLPFLLSGSISSVTDAFFESMSGFTTTGASILTDIEAVSPSILFWRSLTQWIGGMGIIVLSVAILPLLGIGGIELFVAEVPGPTSDKIHPRIQETAKRLWFVYVGLTALLFLGLNLSGMSRFDAINHAFTTMATGGFSTKNNSLAHWDIPSIQYLIVIFMFLAGTNFTIIYYFTTGRFRRAWKSTEFRAYSLGMVIASVVATLLLFQFHGNITEKLFRDALFQVVSVVSTTGFVSSDYTAWGYLLTFYFFLLMFTGGSAGSTAGGIKTIRHLVFLKNSYLEFKRILHPRAIIRIKLDHQVVAPRILTHILVFLLVYLGSFVTGTLVMTALGTDLVSSAGAVATCLGNIGPGLGTVGPVSNFAATPDTGKWALSILMLLGRLELFTVLVLFTPFYWRAN